jgi:hypothetical protein
MYQNVSMSQTVTKNISVTGLIWWIYFLYWIHCLSSRSSWVQPKFITTLLSPAERNLSIVIWIFCCDCLCTRKSSAILARYSDIAPHKRHHLNNVKSYSIEFSYKMLIDKSQGFYYEHNLWVLKQTHETRNKVRIKQLLNGAKCSWWP